VRRWILPSASATACVLGVVALVPPALAAAPSGAAAASAARPSVHLEGTLETAGLPSEAALSTLTVVNDGTVPIRWSVRGTLQGDAAHAAAIAVLAPVAGACSSATAPLAGWSAAALPPGGTAVVCVRVSTRSPAAGTVVPTVTVDAQAA